jgi:glucosyl-3-phosphoglycerate synthase
VKGLKCRIEKIALFDMDNTLLLGRFIDKAAAELGFADKLEQARGEIDNASLRTQIIAGLLKGVSRGQIFNIADSIPVVPDAAEVIAILKDLGYMTAIVSDSYQCVVRRVADRIGMDLIFANQLEFVQNRATGHVTIPGYFQKTEGSWCEHTVCKSHVVRFFTEKCGIASKHIVAVGDSENDICMVRFAGVGVSFCSQHQLLKESAKHHIESKAFRSLLTWVQ